MVIRSLVALNKYSKKKETKVEKEIVEVCYNELVTAKRRQENKRLGL